MSGIIQGPVPTSEQGKRLLTFVVTAQLTQPQWDELIEELKKLKTKFPTLTIKRA